MKTIIKLILITAFFYSCQPSIKKEHRLSDKFNFEQVLYTYYKSPDYGGLLPHYGSITINDSEIKISVNTDEESVEEIFKIQRVTYNEKKNEFDYGTNAGTFILEMNNKQIKNIIHLSKTAMTIFYEENKSNKNSPKTFINKTERMFNDYLPDLLKSKGEYSSIYNQETHIGDFNGDGIEDVIIWFVYGNGGSAIGGVEAAFYENQNGKPIVVAGFEPNYRFNIDNISNGVVYCTKRLFAKDDINCCPSIEIQIELIYDNKILTVFEK